MATDISKSAQHLLERMAREGTADSVPVTAVASLTDNSGGVASDTLADMPASYTEATHAAHVASLAAKINAILVALRAAGIVDDGS